MTLVLEPCTVADLNVNEDDPRFASLEQTFYSERCYLTAVTLGQIYRKVRDAISTVRADLILETLLSSPRMMFMARPDEELVRAIAEIRDLGVGFQVAECAALSKSLKIDILTNEPIYDRLAEAGLCTVRHY